MIKGDNAQIGILCSYDIFSYMLVTKITRGKEPRGYSPQYTGSLLPQLQPFSNFITRILAQHRNETGNT